jgi:hypothetical protein
MRFQDRTRRSKLVSFRKHQGVQQLVRRYCNVTLGEPLQENPRPLGIVIEERRGGGEQQDKAIAWLRSHRLFGLRQKS